MIAFPILRSRPARVVGIPVAREISFFTFVTPRARFHEKLNPGIFIICSYNFKSPSKGMVWQGEGKYNEKKYQEKNFRKFLFSSLSAFGN